MPLRTNPSRDHAWPSLVPLWGDGSRPAIALSDLSILLGSGSAAQIRLRSKSVNEAHALILVDRGRAYIRDLASRTHLFVNQKPVREAELRQRDVIRVGAFNFAFAEGEAVGDSPTPADVVPRVGLHVEGETHLRLLTGPVVLVGDHDGCDLILAPHQSAGAHLAVFHTGGRWHVRDLGSQTAKAVNGVPLKRQLTLANGDTIEVDSTRMHFVESSSSAPPAGVRADTGPGADVPETGARGEGAASPGVGDTLAGDVRPRPAGPAAALRPQRGDLGTPGWADAPASLVNPGHSAWSTTSKIRSIADGPREEVPASASVPLFTAVTDPASPEVEDIEGTSEGWATASSIRDFPGATEASPAGENKDRVSGGPSAGDARQPPTVWGFSELTRRLGAPPASTDPEDLPRRRPVGTRRQIVAVVVICLVCVLLVGILVVRQIW